MKTSLTDSILSIIFFQAVFNFIGTESEKDYKMKIFWGTGTVSSAEELN